MQVPQVDFDEIPPLIVDATRRSPWMNRRRRAQLEYQPSRALRYSNRDHFRRRWLARIKPAGTLCVPVTQGVREKQPKQGRNLICVALARASVFQAKSKADLLHDRPMPKKLCQKHGGLHLTRLWRTGRHAKI